MAGREARGVVGAGEQMRWLDAVEETARGFRTADGQEVFAGLWRTAAHASGPRVHRLPDALLMSNRGLTRVAAAADALGRRLVNVMEERRNGVHTGEGFLYMRPAAGLRVRLPVAVDARDFAPSAWELLGVRPPAGYEGRSFAGSV